MLTRVPQFVSASLPVQEIDLGNPVNTSPATAAQTLSLVPAGNQLFAWFATTKAQLGGCFSSWTNLLQAPPLTTSLSVPPANWFSTAGTRAVEALQYAGGYRSEAPPGSLGSAYFSTNSQLYMQVASSAAFNPLLVTAGVVKSCFSVDFWIYPTKYNAAIILDKSNGNVSTGWLCYFSTINPNSFAINFVAASANMIGYYTPPPLNQWTHIFWGWDGTIGVSATHLRVYYNGVRQTEANTHLGSGAAGSDASNNLLIGKPDAGLASSSYLNGFIEGLRFWRNPSVGSFLCPDTEVYGIYQNAAAGYPGLLNYRRRTWIVSPPSVPGVPTGLAASYSSPTAVALNWTQGSGTVTDNKVQYSTDNTTWTTVDLGSASTSTTITGLTKNQLYFFRVDAENTGGGSGYTSSVLWVCGCNFGGQVGASNQDAFQNTLGTVTIADATDTLIAADYLGFAFSGVSVAQFADVSAAFLVLNLASVAGIAGSVSIDMQAGIAGTFSASSNNISNRTTTGEGINWPIAGLASGWNQSPNFASAVQAVVDNATWASGSQMAAIAFGLLGAAGFNVNMWDGTASLAAYLFIADSSAGADEAGTFGDQMGMMAASNAFVVNESHDGAFVPY